MIRKQLILILLLSSQSATAMAAPDIDNSVTEQAAQQTQSIEENAIDESYSDDDIEGTYFNTGDATLDAILYYREDGLTDQQIADRMLLSQEEIDKYKLNAIKDKDIITESDMALIEETNAQTNENTNLPSGHVHIITDYSTIDEDFLDKHQINYKVDFEKIEQTSGQSTNDNATTASFDGSDDEYFSQNVLGKDNYTATFDLAPGEQSVSCNMALTNIQAYDYSFTNGIEQRQTELPDGGTITTCVLTVLPNETSEITIKLTPNKNLKVSDVNLAPELDQHLKDVISGKYAESVAAEEAKQIHSDTPMNEPEVNMNKIITVVIVSILLIIGAGLVLIKRYVNKHN